MNTAIIGLGVIGKVHAEVLFDQKENVVALCDIDLSKAQLVKDKYFNNAKIYSSYEEMLSSEKLDVVHICTPHNLHASMCIYALNKNVNVFCEKPLAINFKEIEDIIKAEKSSKAILGVCHQNRYLKQNIFLKENAKKYGFINAYGTLLWNRDKDYYSQDAWRGKKATEGGGVMINQALHTLDILEWVMGEPSEVVSSVNNLTLNGVIDVEDTAVSIFSGGANFSFFASNGSKESFPIEMTFIGNGVKVKVFENSLLINGKIKTFKTDNKVYGKACYGTGHKLIIKDFYAHVSSGKKFWLDATEGSKVLKLIFAIYESKGNKISIK